MTRKRKQRNTLSFSNGYKIDEEDYRTMTEVISWGTFEEDDFKTIKSMVNSGRWWRLNHDDGKIDDVTDIDDKYRVVRLELHSLPSLSPVIGNLTRLKHLDIHAKNFSSLPAEISNLVNLEQLKLSSSALHRLPMEIGNLK